MAERSEGKSRRGHLSGLYPRRADDRLDVRSCARVLNQARGLDHLSPGKRLKSASVV